MNALVHIADRVLNRPLLVTPDKAQVILSVLAGRIGVISPEMSRFEGDSVTRDPITGKAELKPYRVTSDGVGIITITGSLVARGAWLGSSSGLTSYEGIQHQIKTAKSDGAVRAAIVDLHTPGGEATLAFETAALVRELAAVKRTVAVVNGMAASAGYAIASGASEVVTAETGISGSIGVVLLHADFSRKLDREGITPTLIHAGAHKVDGHPYGPLSDAVLEDLQAEVDFLYEAFLTTVAKGRGSRLNVAAARKTEARTFMGKAAVEIGLADRIGSFDTVLAELSRASGRKPVQTRRTSMDTNDQPATSADAGHSAADNERAVNAARAEGAKSGATAERERFKAVFGAEQYKGREASAHTMLTTTDMTAEAIIGVLATLPANAAKAEATKTSAVEGRGELGISTVGDAALPKAGATPINTQEIYGSRRKATAS